MNILASQPCKIHMAYKNQFKINKLDEFTDQY